MSKLTNVVRARSRLVLSRPFYGTLALRMKVVEDPSCRTAWTNGKVFGYNPAFLNKLPVEQVVGVWAHECLHGAFMHITRRGWRESGLWNIACDYAINPILQEDGLMLPPQAIVDARFAGMSAEEIYRVLAEEKRDGKGGDFMHDQDPGGCGEVRDAGDPKVTEQEWKQAVAQAAHAAKVAGKLPASLERFLDGLFYTPTPWRDILRRFITERSNDDYSWMRGNRRYLSQGLYLPSAWSETMGAIACIVDTSGSIGQAELNLFGSEINMIVEDAMPSKLHRIFCDAAVHRTDEYAPGDDIPWKNLGAIGGGGTDFRPPFLWLEEQGIEPQCAVYLTDMYGSFPEEPPAFPVLWASISKNIEAPFGETVLIDDKGGIE